jgi:hypothetical protein
VAPSRLVNRSTYDNYPTMVFDRFAFAAPL